jgi:transposase
MASTVRAVLRSRRFSFAKTCSMGLLDQLQLADLEENAAQAETAAQMAAAGKITVPSFKRRRPARRPLPEHLLRERIVYPVPAPAHAVATTGCASSART